MFSPCRSGTTSVHALLAFTILTLLLLTYANITSICFTTYTAVRKGTILDVAVYEKTQEQRPRSTYSMPTPGEHNIIFLETTCAIDIPGGRSEDHMTLTLQAACAIESAARTNPNSSVYLFYSCPLNEGSLERSAAVVRDVFDYPNVHVWHESMESFFQGTPLEEFYRSGNLSKSSYPAVHASDVMRFLVLKKFGGIYLDLDFIVLRPLDDLSPNWACAEVGNWIGNGALAFSTVGVGKLAVDIGIEDLRTNFRGNTWAHNGPGLITRTAVKLCGYSDVGTMISKSNVTDNCQGFRVLAPKTFYPIIYSWEQFFNEKDSDNLMDKITEGHAVHLWNALMGSKSETRLVVGSRQPMARLQEEFCPMVYKKTPRTTTPFPLPAFVPVPAPVPVPSSAPQRQHQRPPQYQRLPPPLQRPVRTLINLRRW